LASFYAGKGELLELALNQVGSQFLPTSRSCLQQLKLDTLGIKVGHLPALPPFSTTFAQQPSEVSKDVRKRSSLKISKAELLSSLTNPDAFYDLYVSVTNRAIDMCTKSGRRKFALKLWGCLAALDVYVVYRTRRLFFIHHVTATVVTFRPPSPHIPHYLLITHRTTGHPSSLSCFRVPSTLMRSLGGRKTGNGFTLFSHSSEHTSTTLESIGLWIKTIRSRMLQISWI
jgi:hypothetical protein